MPKPTLNFPGDPKCDLKTGRNFYTVMSQIYDLVPEDFPQLDQFSASCNSLIETARAQAPECTQHWMRFEDLIDQFFAKEDVSLWKQLVTIMSDNTVEFEDRPEEVAVKNKETKKIHKIIEKKTIRRKSARIKGIKRRKEDFDPVWMYSKK